MFVTMDDPNIDFKTVNAISEANDRQFKLYDYVRIFSNGDTWVGQIIEPNRNISTMGRPFEPSIIRALELAQEDNDIQMADYIRAWRILLLGQYDEDGIPSTLRVRPSPGSKIQRLNKDETISFLHLPESKEGNIIGLLLNADDVPLCVDNYIYDHHIAIPGSTGSGKSNGGANLVMQAERLGRVVFLYDPKPDFKLIDKPNSDTNVSRIWASFEKYNIYPTGAEKLTRIGLYRGSNSDYSQYDVIVGFRASDFGFAMLSGLFPSFGDNQAEEFEKACYELSQKQKRYSLGDIRDHLEKKIGNDRALDSTLNTTIRKMGRLHMPWIDCVDNTIIAKPKTNKFDTDREIGQKVVSFDIEYLIALGGIIHLDCSGLQPEEYALILSMSIGGSHRYLSRLKANGIPASKLSHYVDEAHRLFEGGGRYRSTLTHEFKITMSEGRTLGNGIILALQNATDIPPEIMTNINSYIVMKQNNTEVARAATQAMGRNYADLTMGLATGQALCKMFESSAPVLVQMAPSPYELQRSDING